jgi:integrase
MPPFPKKEDYGIVEPTIKWLTEDRQMAIINAVPEVHRPIFLWLKYHYRRPAEACALKWEDWDAINQVFLVRRSISARRVVESTKTGVEHIIPCDERFLHFMQSRKVQLGCFVFQNPLARKHSKRYTNESLNNIWRVACQIVGESIDLYSGLKHSSCSQLVNEKGMALSDVQALTDHARLDSVKRYAKVGLARKRALMDRAAGVIDLFDYQQTTNKANDGRKNRND